MEVWALLTKSFYEDTDNLPPHLVKVDIDDEAMKKIVLEKFTNMGIETAACRECGAPIIFLPTKNGKQMPVNLSLNSHFSDCPAAAKFRKSK